MELKKALSEVLYYWQSQKLQISSGCSDQEIKIFENRTGVSLPIDFQDYFRLTNGLNYQYPNESDTNGFLFYPLNEIEIVPRNNTELENFPIIIFADYMQKSWEYYAKLIDQDKYEIGIRPSRNTFKYITSALADFLHYYVTDDEILYSY